MKLHSCILLINETHKFMSLNKLNTSDKRSTQFHTELIAVCIFFEYTT